LYKQYRDIGITLIDIFTKAPNKTSVTSIHGSLNVIRQERNKLAHHEPVIFKRGKNRISFYNLDFVIQQVLLITKWLDIPLGFYDRQLKLIDNKKQGIIRLIK
jgi:hypothetical protein